MFSRSRSGVNIAFCLAAMHAMASTTHAQISDIPKRYRGYRSDLEFGRDQRRQSGDHQRRQNKRSLQAPGGDFSMPLEESDFEMSVPLTPVVRMMSISLQESNFEISMPLEESDFDLSMPIGERPAQTSEDNPKTAVALGDDSDSDGGVFILASFLAGISALVIGAMAFFVKVRQHRRGREEGSREREDVQIRVVSFASPDEFNERGELREIVIT